MTDKNTNLVLVVNSEIIESNFDQYAAEIIKRIDGINEDLKTDEDFVEAKENVDGLKKAEKSMTDAKEEAIKKAEEVNKLFAAIDKVSATARQKRLDLEKLIKTRNAQLRQELIDNYQQETRSYYSEHVETNPDFKLCKPQVENANANDFELVIKGCSSFASMEKRLSKHADKVKAAIDSSVEIIDANAVLLEEVTEQYKTLFQDRRELLVMSGELLESTISQRIATHKAAELERIAREKEAEEKRKTEEQARIAKQQEAEQAAAIAKQNSGENHPPEPTPPQSPPVAETQSFESDPAPTGGGEQDNQISESNAPIQGATITNIDSRPEPTPLHQSYQVIVEITSTKQRAREIAKLVHSYVQGLPEFHRVRLPNPEHERVA